jgi:hypothetical protein
MYHLFCVGSFVPVAFADVSFPSCPLWVTQQSQVEFPHCLLSEGIFALLDPPYVPACVSFSFCRLLLRSHLTQHHLSMPMSHASWSPHAICSCSVDKPVAPSSHSHPSGHLCVAKVLVTLA